MRIGTILLLSIYFGVVFVDEKNVKPLTITAEANADNIGALNISSLNKILKLLFCLHLCRRWHSSARKDFCLNHSALLSFFVTSPTEFIANMCPNSLFRFRMRNCNFGERLMIWPIFILIRRNIRSIFLLCIFLFHLKLSARHVCIQSY